jgi:arsenate reductase-like glutaredoxin family protein
MLEEPNLIRRPLVLAGRDVVFGFDAAAYDRLDRKR